MDTNTLHSETHREIQEGDDANARTRMMTEKMAIMSDSPKLDTHGFFKTYLEGGFTEQQAEALIATQLISIETHLATKADVELLRKDIQETNIRIEQLRKETTEQIEQLRKETTTQIEQLRKDTNTQIASLRNETKTDMAGLKVDLLKWIIGALTVQASLIITLIKFL